MRVFYSVSAVFDDSNLVSTAGLALALALADRAGLHEVIGEHLSVPGSAGSNATVKVAALVTGVVWHWLTRRSVTRSRPSTPRCGRASLRVAQGCAPTPGGAWPRPRHGAPRQPMPDHPRHQGRDLDRRVRPGRPRNAQVLADHLVQPGPIGERQRQGQTRCRHEIGIIEYRRNAVKDSHLPDALLLGGLEPQTSPIVPGQKGIRLSRPAHRVGGSRISQALRRPHEPKRTRWAEIHFSVSGRGCGQPLTDPDMSPPMKYRPSRMYTSSVGTCLLYTSPSPRDGLLSRM